MVAGLSAKLPEMLELGVFKFKVSTEESRKSSVLASLGKRRMRLLAGWGLEVEASTLTGSIRGLRFKAFGLDQRPRLVATQMRVKVRSARSTKYRVHLRANQTRRRTLTTTKHHAPLRSLSP